MPHQTPATPQDTGLHPHDALDVEAAWPEDERELPRRPRRRLLTPASLSLTAVLLLTCGFIGGVLVEKGQSGTTSAGAGGGSLASRIAALRGVGAGAGSARGAGASSTVTAAGGFSRPTSGQVAYLSGTTLYVTGAEGNTIKVTTSPATAVTKSVKASVKGIHPGETVSVTGATASSGTVHAESISVGSAGRGLASLFGAARSERGSSGAGASGGGGPSLFGG
jgi:hypothetical protein